MLYPAAEPTVPAAPDPLVLTRVAYDISFRTDDRAAGRAREIFRQKQIDRATRGRVAGHIAESL